MPTRKVKSSEPRPPGAGEAPASATDQSDALQSAVERLPIGVVVIEAAPGERPEVVSYNEAYRSIVASTPAAQTPLTELRHGLYLADRVTPLPPPEWPGPRAALTGAVVYDQELHLRREDGSWRVVRTSAAPFGAVEPGRPRRAVAVLLDVTAQHEAAEALRQSEARFRDVVASADEYVFELDARGVVTYVSEAVEAVLGRRPEELLGHGVFEYLDAGERQGTSADLAERLGRRERLSHLQVTLLHRSGRKVWLDVSAVPMLGPDGALTGYRGTAMDVTARHQGEAERSRLQAQLAQAQKMEVVGRLAGGVAHDFNNLLTVILTCALEAREVLGGGARGEPADEIIGAARRGADLTRQLLAFARRQVVAPEVVDLNESMRQACKLLDRVIGEDVRLEVRLAEGLRPVRCDPSLIGQVLLNLAVNARDAMPGGGTIALSTANRAFTAAEPRPDPEMPSGHYAVVRVRDTGVGMGPEVMEHLFEPFFTTKPPGKGSGLGLATVYGIVRQAGGYVTVESAPGAGATFEVWLPAPAALSQPRRPEEPAPAGGSETVLVVEDEEVVRRIVERILRSGGYRVLSAASAAEAVDATSAEPGPIHLVLADVVMPGRGGPEVVRLVQHLRPDTRVLYVSGHASETVAARGVLDEASNFLAKPFTPQSLLERVRQVLDA